MKKTCLVLITLFLTLSAYAQKTINNYKYVVVPKSYDFLGEPDKYRLNSLSKFLFEKYGFTALMEGDEYPEDLQKNGCLALYSNVEKDGGLFLTKLKVVLKDCKKDIVYESKLGESREKKYVVAYNKALRDAFVSIDMLQYAYEPLPEDNKSDSEEVKQLKAEIKQLKEDNTKSVDNTVNLGIATTNKEIKEVSPSKDTDSALVYQAKLISNSVFSYDVFANGEKVFTLLYTGKEDIYMIKDKNAVVYKLNGNWVKAEQLNAENLKVKVINLKF
ncbi:hypothetical protein [Mangrovimonas spongiae]|uniref:Uncharacterized protein n=1 Tax=Mangrovimonas spongiae TaxID=2494697 RepID=A0A3R9NRR0_9FLAO|nr:hypothetical protein [Mangrovimonas spongiae]RSK42071.1 hypothetical protein EJA19_04095 [Mangrovimonas spongiae]